ncbi:MAG: hypothetical protein JXQ29_06090 [Planctomycetes bacterium]|nr:hypothetical protein [Planctomycetota bacterium]
MITVLVGHRGTGKTALLRRIARYRPEAILHDLDECIERGEGLSIAEIFRTRGEAAFRELERDHLARLMTRCSGAEPVFIAVGAGFPGPLPPGVHCLWVRRDSDRDGRIFLDRPRLDPALDPLEEYRRRFAEREPRYRAWADDVLTLGEGFIDEDPGEVRFFAGREAPGPAAITLLPEHVRPDAAGRERLAAWARRHRARGVGTFELRDDLLSPGQLRAALDSLPAEQLLYSFRMPPAAPPRPWPAGLRFDWDISLGRCPHGAPAILSLHARTRGETLGGAAQRLEAASSGGENLKLAVEVGDFAELLAGHRWALGDPERRAFLPGSEDGRWAWYRLAHGRRQPLAFVREGAGSAPDQPTLAAWLRYPGDAAAFAAVLGDPVRHSWSPAAHHEFFARRGLPVLAVRVTEADWQAGAFEILAALGLRYAAVTAPLKAHAFRAAAVVAPPAGELGAVNTLYGAESGARWHGTNTDLEGLRAALDSLALPDALAVWGGGGMLSVLRACLPGATFVAARSGRRTAGPPLEQPRAVVWAGGDRTGTSPPDAWRPEQVVDLDYRDSAPGRAWALRVGAHHVSGATLFHEQARRQQAWWDSVEKTVS